MSREVEDRFCQAGDLRYPCDLLSPPEADDFRGVGDYAAYGQLRASWTPLRGDRAVVANQLYGRVTIAAKVRYDSRIKPGHKIRRRDSGSTATIVAVVPVDGGIRWMELLAIEAS